MGIHHSSNTKTSQILLLRFTITTVEVSRAQSLSRSGSTEGDRWLAKWRGRATSGYDVSVSSERSAQLGSARPRPPALASTNNKTKRLPMPTLEHNTPRIATNLPTFQPTNRPAAPALYLVSNPGSSLPACLALSTLPAYLCGYLPGTVKVEGSTLT